MTGHILMPLFRNAQFVTSIARPVDLAPTAEPEVAFAGRSNAGKSSAINTLTDHNRLAYVSKTPGRTQLINFFRLVNGAMLVDLPGYGYAKVPEEIRAAWTQLLERYLTQRANLVGLVLIMDSRHPITPLDRQMLDWFAPRGKPIHVLLTKSDKLTRGPAAQTLIDARRELAKWGPKVSVQLFSSLKKIGAEDVEKVLGQWFAEAGYPEPQPPPPPPPKRIRVRKDRVRDKNKAPDITEDAGAESPEHVVGAPAKGGEAGDD